MCSQCLDQFIYFHKRRSNSSQHHPSVTMTCFTIIAFSSAFTHRRFNHMPPHMHTLTIFIITLPLSNGHDHININVVTQRNSHIMITYLNSATAHSHTVTMQPFPVTPMSLEFINLSLKHVNTTLRFAPQLHTCQHYIQTLELPNHTCSR